MDIAALSRWTPVALELAPAGGTVDWGDLAGLRFAEPFFDQTVERWAGGSAPRLIRTDLAALETLDQAPSLDPAALIFHLSRCGSTLISRLLAQLAGTLVIVEPRPINTLLADPGPIDDGEAARLLRLLVRALGRRRFGDEHHYVLKLSSWNIARLDLFRRAFPGVPVIWVQRAPAEILASMLSDPPGWSASGRRAAMGRVLGCAAGELASLDVAGFCARALETLLAAAGGARDLMVVDYRDLPDAIWTRLAPAIGVSAGTTDILRLGEEARYHAKHPGRRLFTGDPADRPSLPEPLRQWCAERLEPLYHALDARRPATGDLE